MVAREFRATPTPDRVGTGIPRGWHPTRIRWAAGKHQGRIQAAEVRRYNDPMSFVVPQAVTHGALIAR